VSRLTVDQDFLDMFSQVQPRLLTVSICFNHDSQPKMFRNL